MRVNAFFGQSATFFLNVQRTWCSCAGTGLTVLGETMVVRMRVEVRALI